MPLYRSARFLEIIRANLEAVAAIPSIEVIVSDRHVEDDALAQLHDAFGHDARFRFLEATDRIGWVAHHNWLLQQGRGRYFGWMAHDDTFPAGYHAALVDHLEANPETLLACGPLVAVDEQGQELPWARHLLDPPQWNTAKRWTWREACDILRWGVHLPFRGVFRRERVARSKLAVEVTATGWAFGIGLLGRVRFVPAPPCVKRYHAGSAHRTDRHPWLKRWREYRVMAGHTLRSAPSRRVAAACLVRLASMYAIVELYRPLASRLRRSAARSRAAE